MTRTVGGKAFISSILIAFVIGCAKYQTKTLLPSQAISSFEARSVFSTDLRAYLEKNLKREIVPWPPNAWDLPMLTQAAFYYHPDLDVARAKWGLAQAGIITAGQRPNPTLGFLPQYDINPAGGATPWVLDFTLDIPIETAGKRGYRVAQARHLSEAAYLNIAETAWKVRSRLRASLLNLYAADQSESLWRSQVGLQESLVELMQKRLNVGEISRPDVTQFRISLDRARLSLSEAERRRAEGRVQTADALGLRVAAIDVISFSLPFSETPSPGAPPAKLRRQALLTRPDLLKGLTEYAATESTLQLEIAKQYPNLRLGPGYLYDQGENKWGLGISITLPVLNRNQGPIAEAEARRTEAGAAFLSLQAQVIGEIDRALAGFQAAMAKLKSADSLVSDRERQRHQPIDRFPGRFCHDFRHHVA